VRAQLSASLIGVVAQRLLPRTDKPGRIAAFEILLATTAVQALIRDNRQHQILATMETSAKDGMVTLDKALKNLYTKNLISRQTLLALAKAPDVV
jgi:twitching motility protein PilT